MPQGPGLIGDTTLCQGNLVVLKPGLIYATYQCSDWIGSSSRVINQPGTNGLRVTNSYGCSTAGSITVSVKPAPPIDLGSHTPLCTGVVLLLNASAGNPDDGYLWQDGSTQSYYLVRDSCLYTHAIS